MDLGLRDSKSHLLHIQVTKSLNWPVFSDMQIERFKVSLNV